MIIEGSIKTIISDYNIVNLFLVSNMLLFVGYLMVEGSIDKLFRV